MTLLNHFPYTRATAARNMAFDAAMLARAREKSLVFWRFYGWSEPAVTFGYSQRWEWVRQQTGSFHGSCVRRITGGGIVDHRRDLTYALAIPASHPHYRQPALDIYQSLHAGIAEILAESGIRASLVPCPGPCDRSGNTTSGVCFQSPEPYDVVDAESGAKLAGAAMKRNKDGVLVQGSLSPSGPEFPDSGTLSRQFGKFLETWLASGPSLEAADISREVVDHEEMKFASNEWNLRR